MIDRNFLQQSIQSTFPGLYLTSMSVIQGMTLASLSWNVFASLKEGETHYSFWALAFLTFGMILCIWYEYSWFVVVFRWSPTFVDALIPYLLGVCEAGLAFTITQPKLWLIIFCPFSFSATLAFFNTYHRTVKPLFGSESKTANDAYRLSKAVSARNSFNSVLGFVVCIVLLCCVYLFPSFLSDARLASIALIIFGLPTMFILWDGVNFWYELQNLYGIAPSRGSLFVSIHKLWLNYISDRPHCLVSTLSERP